MFIIHQLKRLLSGISRMSLAPMEPKPSTVASVTSLASQPIALDQEEALMNEICITVNEDDLAIGSRTKRDCHLMDNIDKGLLHRAFSVLLFNKKGEFLLTQRASTKVTFPNFYTNACCSHPLFTSLEREEQDCLGVRRAAQRKLFQELGINPTTITLDDIHYITRILYKSPSPNEPIWGEHELDYILIIHKDVELQPNPNEVREAVFLGKDDLNPFLEQKKKEGWPISPWFQLIHDRFLYNYWDNLSNLLISILNGSRSLISKLSFV